MMGRLFRGLCLVCFCILLVALAIAVLDLTLLSNVNAFGSCERLQGHAAPPGFFCTGPLLDQAAGFVLNLPVFFFFYAPLITLFSPPSVPRSALLLWYAIDAVIVFGMTYPVLVRLQRWRTRPKV
jgi:hypothetical protein